MIALTNQRIIFPFYHVVSDEPKAHYKHLYPIKSVKQFEEDLEFLLNHFDPISLEKLIEIKHHKKKVSKPTFHLTFDDGLSELHDIVSPILIKKGIPATFFVNTDFIDNKDLFFRFKASLLMEEFYAQGLLDVNYLDKSKLDDFASTYNYDFKKYIFDEKPYLTSQQIKKLINDGFTFGGHSKNHPLYSFINLEEQLNQTLESVNDLTRTFNLKYKVFSFPFTDVGISKKFYETINQELDLTFGTAGIKHDFSLRNLQRTPLESGFKAEKVIKSAYLYYWFKKFVGKNSIKRKS